MKKQEAYLIGLMCGRGHILKNDKKLMIEFAHKEETAEGIAYCEDSACKELVTKKKGTEEFRCKVCNRLQTNVNKPEYQQVESTLSSLKNVIIPFIKSYFTNVECDLVGNNHLTNLIINFSQSEDEFDDVVGLFDNKVSFDKFRIPEKMNEIDEEAKIEFVNGLLDTSGFFNAGSWIFGKGENGYGIMRGYFQIVRNWYMPVDICDYLYHNFNLKLQTIDWGHPNMRDQKKIFAWGREHQVKFYPEEYTLFKLRIKHKQEMFDELVGHNNRIKPYNQSYFKVGPIKEGRINNVKPNHPFQEDNRIPREIRGHFNTSWQICYKLGCKYIIDFFKDSPNIDILYDVGENVNEQKYKVKIKEINDEIQEKTEAVEESRAKLIKKKRESIIKKIRTNPEQQLYGPIATKFKEMLERDFGEDADAYDTSTLKLNRFIYREELVENFELYDGLNIRPDIFGFLKISSKICLVEVKVNELTLQDLGQLLGYCLVAKPELAILISPKGPSLTLENQYNINDDLLYYGEDKKIKIAKWNNEEIEILN